MIGLQIITWAIKLTTGTIIKDPISEMHAINRKFKRACLQHELSTRTGCNRMSKLHKGAVVKETQVIIDERISGVSYLNFTGSLKYMSRMLISILLVQGLR